jgi:hypothetical protein
MRARTSLCVLAVAAALLVLFTGPTRGGQQKGDNFPTEATWVLLRDFKVDGQVTEPQMTKLELTAKGGKLVGYFLEKRALHEENNAAFSGEIVAGERSHMLILRQELTREGNTYVVIHTGQPVGPNHYRGTWHDTSGNAGDFELKVEKVDRK